MENDRRAAAAVVFALSSSLGYVTFKKKNSCSFDVFCFLVLRFFPLFFSYSRLSQTDFRGRKKTPNRSVPHSRHGFVFLFEYALKTRGRTESCNDDLFFLSHTRTAFNGRVFAKRHSFFLLCDTHS